MPGQANDTLLVSEINFTGLNKTKTEYLFSFLQTKTNQFLNKSLLDRDRQVLLNLEGIADVKYQIDTLAKGLSLTFQIKEALTFFPIINFGGVQGNFWYQLGITDANWRGRGIKLTTFYQNIDGRHNFNFHYRNPYIRGSQWGASLNLQRFASTEPLFFSEGTVFYDYDNTSVGATIIRHLNPKHTIELGATYFVEDYRKNNRHEGTVTPGPQEQREPKTLGKFLHYYRNINYHYHQLSGYDNVLNLQTVYNLSDYSFFNILINDTRYFGRIGQNGNFASRLRIGLATNNNSPFAPFVLDSHINIRGSGNRIDRGTATFILNLEYRQTIFNRGNFVSQLVAFSDSGTWRKPGGDLNQLITGETLRHFVGGGLRLSYLKAYNATLRIDYGIDIQNTQERGFVLGVGQFF
ncbi:MAG: hypothetical protein Sapg2KO_05720 [Saprospiraceae bacterium]